MSEHTKEDEFGEEEPKSTEPPRVCSVCKHEECMICKGQPEFNGGGWCDQMIEINGEPDLCCDGECTFSAEQTSATPS